MKKHFVARGFGGTVLLSASTGPEDLEISWVSEELADANFKSIGDIISHPKVATIEDAQVVNESFSGHMAYDIRGIHLTRAEFIIFDVLNQNRDDFVSLQVLEQSLEMFEAASAGSLRTLVSRLRKKLERVGISIITGWKKGYKIIAE